MAVLKLRDGQRIVGTMIRMTRNPAVAQIAKAAGLDFIMFDMEHGPYSIENVSDVAKVARSVGLGIFARVPELAKGYVSRLMDAGVQGIMVPMLSNRAEAQQLVGWARYAPVGKRGLASNAEFTDFGGMGSDAMSFMAEQNRRTLAIAQIETAEAIEKIDEIAAVEGIDVLLIGANDLAVSLGVPGDTMGKVTQDAIGKVADAADKNGKVFAIHSGDAMLEKWNSRMKMVMNTLDVDVLKNGFASIAAKYQQEPK